MEFATKEELYLKLLPAFRVKQRIIRGSSYRDIKNEDIWKYLIRTKWIYSEGLSIAEVVNDIITVEVSDIYKVRGDK